MKAFFLPFRLDFFARVVELVDTQDLKSCCQQWQYGFDSRPGHKKAWQVDDLPGFLV